MSYIGTTKSYRSRTPDELAAHVWTRGVDSSSINYARQALDPVNRAIKAQARDQIARLFGHAYFPNNLNILTMPGLDWGFEWLLLRNREAQKNLNNGVTKRTYIEAFEWDEAIYRIALSRIPHGAHSLRQVDSPPYASDSFRSNLIVRYHRARFDALAEYYASPDAEYETFHGAWLDFSGPITTQRLAAIRALWQTSIESRLVLTAMNARWDAEASEAIAKAGSVSNWILQGLPDSRLCFEDRYQTGVSMIQIGVDRIGAAIASPRPDPVRSIATPPIRPPKAVGKREQRYYETLVAIASGAYDTVEQIRQIASIATEPDDVAVADTDN